MHKNEEILIFCSDFFAKHNFSFEDNSDLIIHAQKSHKVIRGNEVLETIKEINLLTEIDFEKHSCTLHNVNISVGTTINWFLIKNFCDRILHFLAF